VRLAFLLLCLAAVSVGQTWRGTIAGSVVDPSDARVSNAVVTIVSEETARQRTTASDSTGAWSVGGLAPGEYRVEVRREGFASATERVTLNVNQDVRIEVRLRPGDRSEQVSVTAQAELLRTESTAMGAVVENRSIRQLPLDGRNFYELTLLAPGTAPAAQGSAGSVRGDFAIHVNGAREDANNFLLDGVYNGDPKLNGVGVTPPLDAIREFEVLTHTYDASFGRNAGGQINVVLQSGSNSLHGTVWEFFRNAKLDARNTFAPRDEAAPRYQRNQYGFTLGGPLWRNRTFFFGDYEGTRRNEGRTVITNVPTLAERSGERGAADQPADRPAAAVPPGGVPASDRARDSEFVSAAEPHRGGAELHLIPGGARPVQSFRRAHRSLLRAVLGFRAALQLRGPLAV
jgi:hypothetical protein